MIGDEDETRNETTKPLCIFCGRPLDPKGVATAERGRSPLSGIQQYAHIACLMMRRFKFICENDLDVTAAKSSVKAWREAYPHTASFWRGLKSAATNTSYENDPNGTDVHAPGAKLDAGKQRPDLVLDGFPLALQAVTEVSTFGMNKYSEGGWQYVPEGPKRYRAAGDRHRLAESAGERIDPDSGLLHIHHRLWNLLAEIELTLREARK